MAKVDFVPVDGYSVCYHDDSENFELITTPIIGLYVKRHAFATEVLTANGEVLELFPFCVLQLPDGKYAYADMVFEDEDEWLEWAINLENNVCNECRGKAEQEEAERFAKWQAEQEAAKEGV